MAAERRIAIELASDPDEATMNTACTVEELLSINPDTRQLFANKINEITLTGQCSDEVTQLEHISFPNLRRMNVKPREQVLVAVQHFFFRLIERTITLEDVAVWLHVAGELTSSRAFSLLSVLPVLKSLEFRTLAEPLLVGVAASKQICTPGRFASLRKLNLSAKSHTVPSLYFSPQLEELSVDLDDSTGLTREGLLIISKLKNLRSLKLSDETSDGNLHSSISCSGLISYFSHMKMLEQLGIAFLFSDGIERKVSTSDLMSIAKQHPKLRYPSLPQIDGSLRLETTRRTSVSGASSPLYMGEQTGLLSSRFPSHLPTEIEAFDYMSVLFAHCPRISVFSFFHSFYCPDWLPVWSTKNKISEYAEIIIKEKMYLEEHLESELGNTILDWHIAGVGVEYSEPRAAETTELTEQLTIME
ncbi:hypothetical protein E4T38_07500 [Aureobasidium subglaciale]|nr:hypothetical protein E4T38_07500 [Aureobasidium subglaciale]KAI5217286.1 hypothetical protein E4T40_07511 [Aureobasidium subglaciale]KAI5220953.1 hypothetical protein E4T41_07352 [Aureobasidium subglaciale]KAI5258457.1 hypothetical protein E4T46_07329 [Aureobasidium subglaciale]